MVKTVRKFQLAVGLALVVLTATRCIAQQPPTATLQLKLVREDMQSVRPLFRVELHNETARPLILNMGMNVGGKDYAGEIKFSLTDASGRTRHLVKRDPGYVAGRMWPYIVTIPGGGTFALPAIDLIDYLSYEPKIAVLALPVGQYSLTAEYRGHNPNDDFIPAPGQPPFHQYTQEFWIGTVRSNAVAFTLTSSIGDQHAP